MRYSIHKFQVFLPLFVAAVCYLALAFYNPALDYLYFPCLLFARFRWRVCFARVVVLAHKKGGVLQHCLQHNVNMSIVFFNL